MVSRLEPYVTDIMLRCILGTRRRRPERRLAAVEEDARDAASALSRYRDNDRIASVIGRKAFLEGLAIRQDRLRDCRLALIDARARFDLHTLPPVEEVRRRWTTMSLDEKREIARAAIDAVFVAPGAMPVEQRVTICPAGTGPRGLPRRGYRPRGPRPIQPRRGWINAATPPECRVI
jgi:hypothetical protein